MVSSQSDTDYPDDYVNDDVKYLLSWNPSKLEVYVEPTRPTKTMSTARHPPTSISPTKTTTINTSRVNRSTRPAAFYDKHLAEKLVLKHVKLLDTLVVDLAGAVDKSIKNSYQKGIRLPSDLGILNTAARIKSLTTITQVDLINENGVIEHYKDLTATFCLPVASTLALHPSSSEWTTLLRWTKEVTNAKFAIADCALKLATRDLPPMDFVDNDIKPLLKLIPVLHPDIAVWEMKSLTVGDEEVMRGIWEMGLSLRTFAWKACKKGYCKHKEADLKRMAGTLVNAPGFDVLSPPWSLPAVDDSDTGSLPGSQSRDDIGTSRLRKSVYVESSQSSLGGDNPPASVRSGENKRKALSHIPWDHGDTVLAPQGDDRIKKKKVVDNSDSSFKGKAGERREVNAQSLLQQSWAQAVRTDSTILVLHSGNHEIIGIRHRQSQTLYISNVIEPHAATPAYGKIHVGLHIAALWEVMDRIRHEEENSKISPPPDDRGKGESDDKDEDDHRNKRPRTDQPGQGRKPTMRETRAGESGASSGSRTAGGKIDQDVLRTASRRDRLLVHLCYGIYLSPAPAIFVRKGAEQEEASEQVENLSDSNDEENEPVESMDIILSSELAPGSTGIVHIGRMEVEPFGPTVKVAVKLAFVKEHKRALEQEHELYSHMNRKHVSGIPQSLGLFVGTGFDGGAEAPYALVMTYAGVTLLSQKGEILPPVKASLISTLKSIHGAGVLHGDIRLANLCATTAGEAFIVDLSHASKSTSKRARVREVAELCHILGVEVNTPWEKPVPKNIVEETPGLRRSLRIKILQEKKGISS